MRLKNKTRDCSAAKVASIPMAFASKSIAFAATSFLCASTSISFAVIIAFAPAMLPAALGAPVQASGTGAPPKQVGADQAEGFFGENGDMFMEEVVDPKKKPKPKPSIPIDLSRVGVSVDPNGRIVPLKDSADDPWAGTGVKPFVNDIQQTFQPLPFNGYAGASPYGYGVPGYNMSGYANPNLNYRLNYPTYGYGGYGPGYGYPGYGYPDYGPGYGYTRPGISINLGRGGGISFGNPNYYGGGYTPWNTFNSFAPGYYGNGVAASGIPLAGGIGGTSPYSYYGNPYANPYANPYGNPFGNPYGIGYPGPARLATFNLGKFQGAIGSTSPGIYPNRANSIFIPNTTNYSQTSMWRAFNLAF